MVVGGYAVALYGYIRTTDDLDLWISRDPENTQRITSALREFGFRSSDLAPEIFLKEKQIIRLGKAPLRIEIATSLSGVSFPDCYKNCHKETLDGIRINFINLKDLKLNKKACGRSKDLNDLSYLPEQIS
jgi:hypothetical protein